MRIYVHIPFCRSKCAYCDFYSVPRTAAAREYVNAVGREMELRGREVLTPGASPLSLYIGGGTPSVLAPDLFAELMQRLPAVGTGGEVTVEVNPDDVTDSLARVWRSSGANRVSMGVQSFDDSELRAVGRRHDAAGALAAYESLRRSGFDNISLDLIYGLPGQTLQSWQRSLDMLMSLRPEHFSAYMLSYEPGTRLYARLISGKVHEADDELATAMYRSLCESAARHGYEHYEISNFALPGKRAGHNSAYWNFEPYLGLGPGAHSFDGSVRRYNPSDLKDYLSALQAGHTFCEIEEETDDERTNDRIMVGLRTSAGLELAALDDAARRHVLRQATGLYPGIIEITATHIRIPEDHWLLSDAIIRDLMV